MFKPSFTYRFAGLISRWPFVRAGENAPDGPVAGEASAWEQQLRHEAWNERPQFSADLHRRICQAVRHAAIQDGVQVTRNSAMAGSLEVGSLEVGSHSVGRRERSWYSSQRRIIWGSLAVASALIFAGWVGRWNDGRNSSGISASNVAGPADFAGRLGDPPASLATLATLPDRATGRIEQWLQVTLTDRQWAYLGHDARLVTLWFMEDLPRKVPAGNADPEIGERRS